MKKYFEVKFTGHQRIYFKQLLDDMYAVCDKGCYPMYFGYLENCLKSIISGQNKTVVIEDKENG